MVRHSGVFQDGQIYHVSYLTLHSRYWSPALSAAQPHSHPFIFILIYFARPTFTSALIGAIPLILGEFLRLWAVGYAGGATRSRTLGAAQ